MDKKSDDLLGALTVKSKNLTDNNTEMKKLSLEYKSLQKALIVTTEKLHEYNQNNNGLSSSREAERARHLHDITNLKTALKMKSIKLLEESRKSDKLSIGVEKKLTNIEKHAKIMKLQKTEITGHLTEISCLKVEIVKKLEQPAEQSNMIVNLRNDVNKISQVL